MEPWRRQLREKLLGKSSFLYEEVLSGTKKTVRRVDLDVPVDESAPTKVAGKPAFAKSRAFVAHESKRPFGFHWNSKTTDTKPTIGNPEILAQETKRLEEKKEAVVERDLNSKPRYKVI